MKLAGKGKDATSANLADDQHVIVVEGGVTGEVRECGDFSGICVAMNPWTHAIAREQQAPVLLWEHAGQVSFDENAKEAAPITRPPS